MIRIELTEDEVKVLATLIDAAVRHSGIQAVKAAASIIDKMEVALSAAQTEQKDESNA